jgi:hypothetical protein
MIPVHEARTIAPVAAGQREPIFAISDRAPALRAAGVDVITVEGEPEAPTGP